MSRQFPIRKGTRTAQMPDGRWLIRDPRHPRAGQNGYVNRAIALAESALGKTLPPGAEVHHFNGVKSDDTKGNLVVCPDRGYHMILHMKKRAIEACGHANWMKCAYCKKYDDPKNFYVRKNHNQGWHRECHTIHERGRTNARRSA